MYILVQAFGFNPKQFLVLQVSELNYCTTPETLSLFP